MKNFYKFIILSLMVLILTSCQSVVDGISMKKKSNTDQFLIEKKSPLVLPPDFDELPEPASEAKSSEEEEFDIKNVLGQTSTSDENKKTDSSSIKNTIMKKIK
ncbi:DUF3035 domain-containing protein [Candidatus Pelagibacter bacterium]|nr:DUF3035 domain-containing protein [Candidatus Pelagibacter bacterium]